MAVDVIPTPHQLIASDRVEGTAVRRPNGEMIGHIHLPEPCANLVFGGRSKNRLFMCGSQSIYSLYIEAQGAQSP